MTLSRFEPGTTGRKVQTAFVLNLTQIRFFVSSSFKKLLLKLVDTDKVSLNSAIDITCFLQKVRFNFI